MPHIDRNSRKYFERRKGAMKTERVSFESHWKDLAQFVQPRRGRFFTSDRNKGDKRHNFIINNKASQAHKIARAGLFAGVMSPTRPWFKLTTPDAALSDFAPVRIWLDDVEAAMRNIFNQSNLYNMAPSMLGELLLFGTGCMSHVDDTENVARFFTHTIGSYWVTQNERFEIDTMYREMELRVEQIVAQFGLENASVRVKQHWDKGDYDVWIPVTHVVEPNPFPNPTSILATRKPWRSVWYETGTNTTNPGISGDDVNQKFLSTSGFDEFPVYVPRWDTTGEDIYGTDCPGMTSLGDIRGLQVEEKRKAQAIDKMVNPPLTGPSAFRNVPVSSLPGGLSIADTGQGTDGLRPIYTVNPQLNDLKEDIHSVEQRIDQAFFVDMFLAISNMEGIQPRNQLELAKRDGERLLQLGPVLERVHGEFLTRLIDRTFQQMVRADILPPPPEELQGSVLKVEFISSLAQAQRAVATSGIEQLAAFVGQIAQMNPAAVDKFNADQSIDEYSKLIGVSPRLIVSDEDVAIKRAEDARQAQMQQALEMTESLSKSAASASQATAPGAEADLSKDTPISRATNQLQPQQ